MINYNKPYFIISVHVLGWLLFGFILLFYLPLTWRIDVPVFFWTWQSFLLLMMIVLFYINAYYVVPHFLLKSRTGLFSLWIFLIIGSTQMLAYFFRIQTHMRERLAVLLNNHTPSHSPLDTFVFTLVLIMLGVSTSYAVLRHWQLSEQRKKDMERDKTLVELSMLKMQINPHFFFNSLNSVYSLTYTNIEDSRKALLTLSKMMRYILYNSEEGNTTLLSEIDFLNNYISIMRLRASEKVKINLRIPTSVQNYPIASMLLIPFVENAFKHGIGASMNTQIDIQLEQLENVLLFKVENNICGDGHQSTGEGGVGLSNTRRRLELLYPNKHELYVGANANGNYEINLKLHLGNENS